MFWILDSAFALHRFSAPNACSRAHEDFIGAKANSKDSLGQGGKDIPERPSTALALPQIPLEGP
jgi:hypothetical protein